MKPGIHPEYVTVNVHCACGATWTTRSTKGQELRLEICSNCHPFFTGKQKLVDSPRRSWRVARARGFVRMRAPRHGLDNVPKAEGHRGPLRRGRAPDVRRRGRPRPVGVPAP